MGLEGNDPPWSSPHSQLLDRQCWERKDGPARRVRGSGGAGSPTTSTRTPTRNGNPSCRLTVLSTTDGACPVRDLHCDIVSLEGHPTLRRLLRWPLRPRRPCTIGDRFTVGRTAPPWKEQTPVAAAVASAVPLRQSRSEV